MTRTLTLIVLLSITVFRATVHAQEVLRPRSSPVEIASMRYGETYVKLTYSSPQKRGREIFGKLVPYGKVWRTGANEATEITLTSDIMMNGRHLKAGTYSLFTIPERDKWTIIINADVGLWGAYNYDETSDVMRFEVPVQKNTVIYDALTISFDQKNDQAQLLILWDDVKVSVPIQFIK